MVYNIIQSEISSHKHVISPMIFLDDYMEYVGMFLTLLVQYCRLEPHEIFKIGYDVINVVREEDPQYYRHMVKCLSNQNYKSRPLVRS